MLLKKYNILMVGFFFLEGICIKNSERKADQLMHKLKFFYNNTKINVKQKDRETIC